MADTCAVVKQERIQHPTLAQTECRPEDDDQCLASHRTKAEPLTAISSLGFMSSTSTRDIVKPGSSMNTEEIPSPSQSPTLVFAAQNCKVSRTPTPLPTESPMPEDDFISKSSTPTATLAKTPRKAVSAPPQLIGDLPVAREEALASFSEIQDNNYQNKSLGRSRELLESMTCECTYEPGVDSDDKACGPFSDCINRLTQIECLSDDCRCRSHCQNQRFQRKQYANIEIVLTKKKGHGLRAEEDLPKDAFIYEYVGDVVNPNSFKKRMRDYALEGIRHFYFMMLQKDEFIDATKNGGLGRFANHSCNPNCYVAKWTVDNHVRMGIFAKRNIQQHEELTFNYNVDRYGHQAQECFCGEPNCIGFIGGKTQTDFATMDDLYLDALGITDEADLMELKGTKKKKGKKIDDPDFMPKLRAIAEKDVPKVLQAIRQTTSRKVLSKLLTRIRITDDEAALRQIMRLRGYSVMTNVLQDHASDMELLTLALESMTRWPLLNRNKVLDSTVHVPVESCAALENETVKTLAQKLLDHWNTLPVYNRIPKRQIEKVEFPEPDKDIQAPSLDDFKARHIEEEIASQAGNEHEFASPSRDHNWKKRRYDPEAAFRARQEQIKRDNLRQELFQKEWEAERDALKKEMLEIERQRQAQKQSLEHIIASAKKAAADEEAAAAAAIAEAKAKAEAAAERAAKRKERAQKKASMTPQEKEALKEKRLLKLVGAVVVKCMSKYAKSLDRDNFKKYAKELTQVIAEKEKKSSSFREGRLESLSDEKVGKIKKFSKDYITKILHKMEKSGKRHHRRAGHAESVITNTPSTSTAVQTPRSHDDGDTTMHEPLDEEMHMTVEEAMGMESDDDSEDTDDENDGVNGAQGQGNTSMRSPDHRPTVDKMDDNEMEVDDVPLIISQMRPPPRPRLLPLPMAQ